jgi:hypothetical protein
VRHRFCRINHHAESETEGLSAGLWNRNLAASCTVSGVEN